MCGIAGAVGLGPSDEELESNVLRTLQLQRHRGPDELSLLRVAAGAVIGCARLAVVDPTGSKQPLNSICCPVQAVCNGELYNAPELGATLRSRGHRLRTDGDCETLIHLYEDDPIGFVDQLDGMYAFAIWDDREKVLVLARDRLGIKPLYYRRIDSTIYFASEASALARLRPRPALDSRGVLQYVSLRFTFSGSTMYSGIEEVEPGTVLYFRKGVCHTARYWRPVQRTERSTDLRAALEQSVASCADTSTSPGVLLSGGLDSTTVLSVLTAYCDSQMMDPPNSFSVGYATGGDGRRRPQDERMYAAQASKALGAVHREIVLDDKDLISCLRQSVASLSEPVFSHTAVSTWLVASLAASHGKDVFTGDGADELFLGYDYFPRIAAATRFIDKDWRTEYLDAIGWLAEPWRRALVDDMTQFDDVRRSIFDSLPEDAGPLDQVRLIELTQRLPNYQLSRVDRLAMAHGLEARVPFLRNAVVEASLAHTTEDLLRGDRRKQPLLEAVRDLVPEVIWKRPKMKFSAPAAEWLASPAVRNYVAELMLGSGHHAKLGIRRQGVESVVDSLRRDPDGTAMTAWGLLVLFLWADTHV